MNVKRLLAVVLLVAVVGTGATWNRGAIEVLWQGETSLEMMNQVRKDIAHAKASERNLIVRFISPGGSPVFCLEMARMIRNASENGMLIEIHGEGLVASCATWVLASGTPGHRYISANTLFLVHPLQSRMQGCTPNPSNPKDEDEKIVAELYRLMIAGYVRFTGKSVAEVTKWLVCGNETLGPENAVKMGIADQVEK